MAYLKNISCSQSLALLLYNMLGSWNTNIMCDSIYSPGQGFKLASQVQHPDHDNKGDSPAPAPPSSPSLHNVFKKHIDYIHI